MVDGKPLDERTDIQLFSTSGFEWTYAGDAPRQLALALLANHLELAEPGDDIVSIIADPTIREIDLEMAKDLFMSGKLFVDARSIE